MFDWNSFWINILSEGIFLIIGTIVSVSLIPYFTIKLLRKKDINYYRYKITFVIREICYFFNNMPKEFKTNDLYSTIYVEYTKNFNQSPSVAGLSPDLFRPGALDSTNQLITKTINSYSGKKRKELVLKEIQRLNELMVIIENVIDVHAYNLNENLLKSMSMFCLFIKTMKNDIRSYYELESLTNQSNDEIMFWGSGNLNNIYTQLFNILNELVAETGFIRRE